MEKIREIALAFCAVSVFSAAAGLLRGRSLIKSGKYIVGLVFICVLITCFKDFSFSLEGVEADSAYVEQGDISLSRYGAEYLVAEVLRKNSILFTEIAAEATKTDSGDIIINEITVYGAEDEEGVMAVLNTLGIDCRVSFK